MMSNHYRIRSSKKWMSRELTCAYIGEPPLIGCNNSFIGLSGGAIFEKMMLRQGVKVHYDRLPERVMLKSVTTYSIFSDIQEEQFCLSSTLSTTPKISNSSYPVTSKEQVIWQKATPVPQGNLGSC